MKKPIKVHNPYKPQNPRKRHTVCQSLGWGTAAVMGIAYAVAGGHPVMAVIIGITAGIWVYSLARLAAESL